MQIYSRSRNGTYAPQDKPRQSQQQGLQQPNPKLQPQMSPAQLAYQQQMYQQQMNSKMMGNNPYHFFRPPSPPPPPPKVEKLVIDQKAKHDLTGALLPYTFKANNNHLDYMEDENIYIVNNILVGELLNIRMMLKHYFRIRSFMRWRKKSTFIRFE